MLRLLLSFTLVGVLTSFAAYSDEIAVRGKHPSCGGICTYVKKVLAYPNSAVSAVSNKYCTGTWLTSTRAIENSLKSVRKKHESIYGFDGAPVRYYANVYDDNIDEIKKTLAKKDNVVFMVHAMTRPGYVGHSTLFVVGRNSAGLFAMYLDPQGNAPSKAILFDQMANPDHKNVLDVYNAIFAAGNKPDLLYSPVQIQADFISCTAYTALFIMKVSDALKSEGLDKFDPEKFMQKFADDQIATFDEVRSLVQ